jgi:hypothetical protein
MPLEYRKNMSRFLGAACALIAGATLLVAASVNVAVAADDEDDDWYDVKIMRKVLQGIGLRRDGAGIDYRERSPLVVPPSRDLPQPDTNAAPNNPAWPVDPDVKRGKEEAAARRKPGRAKESLLEDDARPLTPAELARGRSSRGGKEGYSTDPNSEARPYQPSALGAKSVFSWDGLFGRGKEESAPFTGEPARSTLTQPPVGYQTPSPNQPYGVAPDRGKGKATTFEERMEEKR